MRDATHYAVMARTAVPPARLAEFAVTQFAGVELDPKASTGGDAVAAIANHGRWLVECPDCHGAQLTHPADRRFLCTDCGNALAGGKYRRVIWPEDHEKITAVLDQRVDEATRNWLPGETLKDLQAENEHMPTAVTLEVPWAIGDWSGHTHRYPAVSRRKGLTATCRDCGLIVERIALEDEPDDPEQLTGVKT